MKRVLYIIALLFTLVGCKGFGESHITPVDPSNNGGAIVTFDAADLSEAKFTDTRLYGFDESQKLAYYQYFETQQEFAKEVISLAAGDYTFVAVLNMGTDFQASAKTATIALRNETLPDLTLDALLSELKSVQGDYPDMISGMTQQKIEAGVVSRFDIILGKSAQGDLSTVKLTITLPDAQFADYQAARAKATEPNNLRGVVEFYKKGADKRIAHQASVLVATEIPGVYTMEMELVGGEYDMLVWADYTESGSTDDLYYKTDTLTATHIIATDFQYEAAGDSREIFYGKSEAKIEGDGELAITLERPLAKYILTATDVERYRSLAKANPEKYPDFEGLNITVLYEGYLPCGFNVSQGKPNHSQAGYKYQTPLPNISSEDKTVDVARDYVIVNGEASSVTLTVVVSAADGRTISRVKGVEVKYKRGMVTTVQGAFLTAGQANQGIAIDTDWQGTHEVEF